MHNAAADMFTQVRPSSWCRWLMGDMADAIWVVQEVKHLPKAAVEAAYGHWCGKRLKAKRPLLQRLWFEQPWVRVREASKEHCGAQGSLRCGLHCTGMQILSSSMKALMQHAYTEGTVSNNGMEVQASGGRAAIHGPGGPAAVHPPTLD